MKILIVNDDGISGKGLITLALTLSKAHTVTVVAPHKQKSGFSHSVSFHKPVTFEPHFIGKNINAYSLTGTPCDCVKFAIDVIMKNDLPDIILCGINDDYNLGTDVVYSATVNAALEGSFLGFPSYAVSVGREFADDFSYPADFILRNLNALLALPRKKTVAYSINFPTNNPTAIKGIRFAPLGLRVFNDRYEVTENEDGSGYLLLGEPLPIENLANTDVEMLKEGYVTVSPVHIQDTDGEILAQVSKDGGLCL